MAGSTIPCTGSSTIFPRCRSIDSADCVPFAYPDYHPRLLKGKKVVVGCPKLDDVDFYIKKLTAIIKENDLNSITVAFMEVPCCNGIVYAAEQAVLASGKI